MVLRQAHGIIAYYSQKLTPSQKNYPANERELLSIVLSLQFFRTIVFGSKVIINTDHKNLLYDKAPLNSRVQRWKLLLSEFNISLNYLPGSKNLIADSLSRCYQVEEEVSLLEYVRFVHLEYNHPGEKKLERTIYELKSDSRGVRNIAIQVCKECRTCLLVKDDQRKKGILLGEIKSERSFEHIASDIVGPFDTPVEEFDSLGEKFWLLTIIDSFSKTLEIALLDCISAKKISEEFFKAWLCRYPLPKRCTTDRGT